MSFWTKLLPGLAVVLATLAFSAYSHAQGNKTFGYIYDDTNQLSQAIDSNGNKINYVFDSDWGTYEK